MTRAVLYSYPLVIACLIYTVIVSTQRTHQHATGPQGYCTAVGEELQAEERRAITLAKRFVERTRMGNSWELDGRFRVYEDVEGYRVHVLFVSGYGVSGSPIFIPGGHCMVNISRNGKIEYGKAPGPSILDAESFQIINDNERDKSIAEHTEV